MTTISLLRACLVVLPILFSQLLSPLFDKTSEKIILLTTLFFIAACLWIQINKYEKKHSIQGSANYQSTQEKEDRSFVDQAKLLLGVQTPQRIMQEPSLFTSEGTIGFQYVTKEVEGRKIFGEKYLMDFRSEEKRNRIVFYLETINNSNYLVFDLYTILGTNYTQRIKIDHWKNSTAYPIFVTWSNKTKEVNLYISGELASLTKIEEEKIFDKTGISILAY